MIYGTPTIITNGLVLNLDVLNVKSIPNDPTINLITDNPTPTNTSSIYSNPASYKIAPTNLPFSNYHTTSYIAVSSSNSFETTYPQTWGWFIPNYSLNNTILDTGSKYTISFEWKLGERNTYNNDVKFEVTNDSLNYAPFLQSLWANTNIKNSGSLSPAVNQYQTTLSDGFTRTVYPNLTPLNTGSGGNIGFRIYGYAFPPTGSDRVHIYWRKLQIEKNIYATNFVSGSRNIWYDLSGNGNNGLLAGSVISGSLPTYIYSNQHMLNFDGVSSYVTASVPQSNSFTYNIWFNRAQSNREQHLIEYSNTQFYAGSNNKLGTSSWITSPFGGVTTLQNNQWYNATLTRDSGSGVVSIYLNGQLENSTASLGTNPNVSKVWIGQFYNGGNYVFSGSIGYVQVYNRPLSQQEIVQNYNALKTRFNLT